VNIDIRRDFFDIARGFKDRNGCRYVRKIGPRSRQLLFIIRD
jgi:hypothetical protein